MIEILVDFFTVQRSVRSVSQADYQYHVDGSPPAPLAVNAMQEGGGAPQGRL